MARGKAVNTQMDSKSISTSGGKSACDYYPHAPFTERAAKGVVPLKIMDDTLGKAGRGPTPTQTAGRESRAPRPGTMQRGFGKSDE
jgi:hypothetical protein